VTARRLSVRKKDWKAKRKRKEGKVRICALSEEKRGGEKKSYKTYSHRSYEARVEGLLLLPMQLVAAGHA
jgi:hypothetical protein